MTGIAKPTAALAAPAVIGGKVANGVLPFTGIALSMYLVIGGALLLTGIILRLAASAHR
jgi:hypothetical protein